MGALSPMHWAIIVIVVLLLFGSRKLPDLARGVGQSLRIFKAETSELRGDGDKGTQSQSQSQTPSQTPAVEQGGSSGEVSTSGPAAPGASAGSGTETATGTSGSGSTTDQRVGDSR